MKFGFCDFYKTFHHTFHPIVATYFILKCPLWINKSFIIWSGIFLYQFSYFTILCIIKLFPNGILKAYKFHVGLVKSWFLKILILPINTLNSVKHSYFFMNHQQLLAGNLFVFSCTWVTPECRNSWVIKHTRFLEGVLNTYYPRCHICHTWFLCTNPC